MELTAAEQKLVTVYSNHFETDRLDQIKMIYGLRLVIADAKKMAAVYGLSLLLGCFAETLCIHLAFIFFRQVAFGIHSEKFSTCLLVSFLVFPGAALVLQKVPVPEPVIWLVCLVSAGILHRFAPAGTAKNATRGPKHVQYLRKKMHRRLLGFAVLLTVLPGSVTPLLAAGLFIEALTTLPVLKSKEAVTC